MSRWALLLLSCAHVALALDAAARLSDVRDALSEVEWRERSLNALVGEFKFYVYAGGAFDAMTSSLKLVAKPFEHEAAAAVWTHRAHLADARRTLNASEADLFVVPCYLMISSTQNHHREHEQRLDAWLAALESSPWFQRRRGADHLFSGISQVNAPNARLTGFSKVAALLNKGLTGAFEVSPGWTGGWARDNIIAMPYVANEHVNRRRDWHDGSESGCSEVDVENGVAKYAATAKKLSLYLAVSHRPHAWQWAGCDRGQFQKLSGYPGAEIVAQRRGRRRLLRHQKHLPLKHATGAAPLNRSAARSSTPPGLAHAEVDFARKVQDADYCPLVCGDTPTSRRTTDVFVGGCLPLFAGSRLWGVCEPPCKQGWGWQVLPPACTCGRVFL